MRRILLVIPLLLALLISQPVFAVSPGHAAFERTWARTDQPVASGSIGRTWMWGPAAFTGPMVEVMTDAPGGGRLVQYFDKSRMEITDPNADINSPWYVTNGLLAKELVSGRLQLGLDNFQDREPARINAAGDSSDPNGPTYASFAGLIDAEPFPEGTTLTTRISRDGKLSDDPALAGHGVIAGGYVPETNHRVASPFWAFMNSEGTIMDAGGQVTGPLFPNPFYATGFPISEAYWATVLVNGEPKDVLIQVFERRVLTYTPSNQPEWQVEAGNVGRHYYNWRYGAPPPSEPPATETDADPLGPTPLPSVIENEGMALITFANHAPVTLNLTISGPETRRIEVPACPDCEIGAESPATCSAQAPVETLELPPGAYTITSSRPGSDARPLSGVWTLVPDAGYGACFFIVEE